MFAVSNRRELFQIEDWCLWSAALILFYIYTEAVTDTEENSEKS
jgi:hypothetical protein